MSRRRGRGESTGQRPTGAEGGEDLSGRRGEGAGTPEGRYPATPFERAVADHAAESLLGLWRDGAGAERLAEGVSTALAALEATPRPAACALLLKAAVERLLLVDHGLAEEAEDDEASDAAARRAWRSDPALSGVEVVRAVVEAGTAADPDSVLFARMGALVEAGPSGESDFRRLLLLPRGRRDLPLGALPEELGIDPAVLDALARPPLPDSVAARLRAAWSAVRARLEEALAAPWLEARLEPSLSGGARTGALLVRATGDPGAVRPVVVRRDGAGGEVVHPRAEEDWGTLADHGSPDGGESRALALAPRGAGPHRYVVLLVPAGTPVDFTLGPDARWAGVLEAAARGEVPASEVEVGGDGSGG